MDTLLVAAAALNQTPIAWSVNADNIREAIRQAQRAGVSVLCLPELCVTGYGCEDAFHSQGLLDSALRQTIALARECDGLVCGIGLPLAVNGAVFNAVCFVVDGEIVGFVAKKHLAGDGIHYEPRWFKPWPEGVVTEIEVDGNYYPCGDILFEVGGVKVGFEICEDAWVANRGGVGLAEQGVDIILNPSASHFAFGKHDIRKRFVVEGSRAFGVAYVYANLLGCESGRVIYDGDTLIASHGELVARGPRFSYGDVIVTTATVDLNRSRLSRYRQSSFRPELHDVDRCIIIEGFDFHRAAPVSSAPLTESLTWESGSLLKHEEFWRAVSLGLFDYLRKSASHGFVVSLSGGVDSSAASCLVVLMVKEALAELGLASFKDRLAHIPWMAAKKSEREITESILACVYQGSDNSSKVTRTAAKEVAGEIGATFLDLNIAPLVEGYEKLVSTAMGVSLSWAEHDLVRQNVQARVRSPSVWLVANLRKALLLSTSNRSEASVGYTTMDGDSSGGLSPLGGIDKAYLRTWLSWLESAGPVIHGERRQAVRFSKLRLVNVQAPTAELRPSKDKQTDERDLMPYVVLDRIERLAVRDKLAPKRVLESLRAEFSKEYDLEELIAWTKRFFRLWSMNQWKRERYAPSFHLDDENVDPKTWCRFPILSGGFAEELMELDTPRTSKPEKKAALKAKSAAPRKRVRR